MTPYYGDFPVNGAVGFLWPTSAVAGESITRATDGTLKIFKMNATAATWATERSSLSGVTQLEDFDATGMHSVHIDLSDNTDAGFYAAANEYQVAIVGAVIDGKTMNVPLIAFSIERANGVLALLKHATYGLSVIETLVDDLESRVGTPSDLGGGATLAQNLSDIEGQTDDIGIAGAGLTALGDARIANLDATVSSRTKPADTQAAVTLVATTTNLTNLPVAAALESTAQAILADTGTDGVVVAGASKTGYSISGTKTTLDALNDLSAAAVNAEVDTAIADARLDELLAADSDIDGAAPPAVGSVFHELLTKTAGSFTYDQSTDSLEALRDRGLRRFLELF